VKVAIALSSGIDSSVAAALLKKRGYPLVGVYFSNGYFIAEDAERLKDICKKLKIPLKIFDLSKEFEKLVVNPFVESYLRGETPNPCVICNKEIKFGLLANLAFKLGVEAFATGHYVSIGEYKGNLLFKKGKDPQKEQSYFLGLVPKSVIPKLIFPLGEYEKVEVKRLYYEIFKKLPKKESQDVCFFKGKGLKGFLETKVPSRKGPIVYKGKVVGSHPGFYHFTIGQRKGLRVRLGKPVYVVRVVPEENKVVLGEESELYEDEFVVRAVNLFLPIDCWGKIKAKIRYRSKEIVVKRIELKEEKLLVKLAEKARGITPGQLCAFYEEDFLVGAGIIDSSHR